MLTLCYNARIMKSKVIVITGGSHGLGKALAEAASMRGATVVILDKAAGDYTIKHAIKTDVSIESHVSDAAEKIVQEHGRIDIWINCAGVWILRSLLKIFRSIKPHRFSRLISSELFMV